MKLIGLPHEIIAGLFAFQGIHHPSPQFDLRTHCCVRRRERRRGRDQLFVMNVRPSEMVFDG